MSCKDCISFGANREESFCGVSEWRQKASDTACSFFIPADPVTREPLVDPFLCRNCGGGVISYSFFCRHCKYERIRGWIFEKWLEAEKGC